MAQRWDKGISSICETAGAAAAAAAAATAVPAVAGRHGSVLSGRLNSIEIPFVDTNGLSHSRKQGSGLRWD